MQALISPSITVIPDFEGFATNSMQKVIFNISFDPPNKVCECDLS